MLPFAPTNILIGAHVDSTLNPLRQNKKKSLFPSQYSISYIGFMDFWGCDSEGYEYDLLPEDGELDLAAEAEGVDGTENMLFEFDLDSPFGSEEDVLLLDEQVMERFQEVESGLSDIIHKPKETNPRVEILGVGVGIFSGDDMNLASPDCGLSSFSLLGDNESWSGNSSFSAINLEMGRQEVEVENDEISEKRLEASVADLSVVDKQGNSECVSSTKVTCQVQGCNADLTSSKDYYKRHRVCPIDTKKAEVIVNGIQKRFCQQCSRFHLLNEFDDDKRSCRKRLAGHNKRRRKPRFETRIHRPQRFQPYPSQGTGPHGAGLPPRRHLLTDLPSRVLFPDIYEQTNGSRSHGGSVYGPMPNNIPSFRNPCTGHEHYTQPVGASNVQMSSGVCHQSCALSLLSNQPQQFPSPYFTTTTPVIIQGHNIFHNPQNKVSFPSPHMLNSSGVNIIQAYQMDGRIFPGTINHVGSTVSGNGHHDRGSLCSNCSNHRIRMSPPQHGSTVNLRQLSFNLSRVEHQRSV